MKKRQYKKENYIKKRFYLKKWLNNKKTRKK